MRESYSIRCRAHGCRFAVLMLQTLSGARVAAQTHARDGHRVELARTREETLEVITARCTR